MLLNLPEDAWRSIAVLCQTNLTKYIYYILSFAANMAPLNAAAECPEISTAPQNPKNEVAILASG